VLIVGGFVSAWYMTQHYPKIIMDERFDQVAHSNWPVREKFEYKRSFQNGAYIFECGRDNWCHFNGIPITFPKHFGIELSSVWLDGKFGEYGLISSR
jgi:hypothetical protein